MKKTVALLLVLSMLFSLCACGGSASGGSASGGAVPAAETEPTPEPTPEKTYVSKNVWLPVRATEEGVADYRLDKFGPVWHSGYRVTEYSYDEYGNTTGETVSFLDARSEELLSRAENAEYYEDVAVERSETGELVSMNMTGETYKPFFGGSEFPSKDTAYFENGRVSRIETVTDNNGMLAKEITAEYYPNGALKREVTSSWAYSAALTVSTFTDPLVSVREFNEDGRCTLLHTEDINLDTDEFRVKEYSWKYDGAGNPVSMNYWIGTANATPITDPVVTYTMASEMRYDAQGRMTSSSILVNKDPNPVEFTYRYDGDGRLTGYDASVGDSVRNEEFEYDENGLLSVDHFTYDGEVKDYSYTWEKGDYALEGSTDAPDGRSVFPYSSMSVYADIKDKQGNLTSANNYVLLPSASTLFPVYMDKMTEYEYEERSILVEVDPEEKAAEEAAAAEVEAAKAEAAAAVEIEYDALKESLLAEGMHLVADDGRLLVACLDQDCVFCMSGLELQDVYTVNKEGQKDRLEYGWFIDFPVDGVQYSIATSFFCFAPGQNDQRALETMQSNMWIDGRYAQDIRVEMSHTSQSITWRCHFSGGESIDFSGVQFFRAIVAEDGEYETWDTPALAQS